MPDTAEALGRVRCGVHGVFLAAALTTPLVPLASLPVTLLQPVGILSWLPWSFYDRLVTPGGMALLQGLLIASLLLSTAGLFTRLTTKTSLLLAVFCEGLLASFGHHPQDRMVGLYILGVLACTPCGEGYSLDARRRPVPAANAWAYGYPILLMQAVVAWTYCSAAVLKLHALGPALFQDAWLPGLGIPRTLGNLWPTHFQGAYWLLALRPALPAVTGLVIAWELLCPIAVLWPRARPWHVGFSLAFHAASAVLLNVVFPVQAAMNLVFIDWPSVAARLRLDSPVRSR